MSTEEQKQRRREISARARAKKREEVTSKIDKVTTGHPEGHPEGHPDYSIDVCACDENGNPGINMTELLKRMAEERRKAENQ